MGREVEEDPEGVGGGVEYDKKHKGYKILKKFLKVME